MKRYLLFLLALTLQGANIPIQLVGVTNTQAVLSYSAPSLSACTVNVTDPSSAVANDVNSTLFSGANSDLRSGNLAFGRHRTILIGHRRSDVASDGKLYSRALETETIYTAAISCNGGSDTGSSTFRTKTVPLGNSAPDPYPFNTNGFGNYGYPSVDYSDMSKTYIDPNTGVLMKRLTDGGYGSAQLHPSIVPLYVYDLGGTWTNVSNVLKADSQYATYTGAGGAANAIFIPTPTAEGQRAFIDYSENYVDDMLARLNGFGDQAASLDRQMDVCLTADAGATCLGNTITMTLPQSSAAEVTGPSAYPKFFFNGWGSPNIHIDWFAADWVNTGTVSVNNSAVTNTTPLFLGFYQFAFPENLQAGDHIHIAGSAPTCPNNDCTVASRTDQTHLTIQQNLGAFQGMSTTLGATITTGATTITLTDASGLIVNYYGVPTYDLTIGSDKITCTSLTGNTLSGCSGVTTGHNSGDAVTSTSMILTNFGLKLWKHTGIGTVSLDSVKYDYASSTDYLTGFEGEGLICSGADVTATYAADGVTPITPISGKTCVISDIWGTPYLYFFNKKSGELRNIARLSASGVSLDSTDPLKFYEYNDTEHSIYSCAYDAANGHFRTLAQDYNTLTNPYFHCDTDLMAGAGNDAVSQIQSHYPQIDFNYFGQPTFTQVEGGFATFQIRPTQNAIAWVCWFDLTKPAGEQLQYCGNSWSTYPLRWGGMHGGFGLRTADGWMTYATMSDLNVATQHGVGLYTLKINTIYNNSNSTALSSTFHDPLTCEEMGVIDARWLKSGATGNNCIKINVATEPVNTSPVSDDLGSTTTPGSKPVAWVHNSASCGGDNTTSNCWSYLQPIAEGDWLRDEAGINNDLGAERFLVAKKTILGDGTIDLVLSREASAAPVALCVGSTENHASGFTLMMDLTDGCGGNEFWTNANDSTHQIYSDNPVPYAAHTDLTYDSDSHRFTQWTPFQYGLGGNNPNGYGFGYGVRSDSLPLFFQNAFDYGVEMAYTFDGSLVGTNAIQTHPGELFSYDTFGHKTLYGLDGRPFGGAGGGAIDLWNETLTHVNGTQNVYQISLPLQVPNGDPITNAGLDRKRRDMLGWYGHTLLKDISGPNSSITDATTNSFCIADFAGECVAGSQAGNQYVSIPGIDVSRAVCTVQYTDNVPCLAAVTNVVGRYTQYDVNRADPTGRNFRILTSLFGGPGKTNNYANIHGTDGTDWAFGVGKWINGVRSMIWGVKLPSWQVDSVYRGGFVDVPIKLNGKTGDTVRIRFGYDTNLYCTTRNEQCSTGATNGDPFAWLSEPVTWTACDTNCVVNIPAYSDRVMYYVIDRKNSGRVVSSALQMVVVP